MDRIEVGRERNEHLTIVRVDVCRLRRPINGCNRLGERQTGLKSDSERRKESTFQCAARATSGRAQRLM